MFLSSQFEGREGCVQTVPWGQGDRADWPDHRVLPQGSAGTPWETSAWRLCPGHTGTKRSREPETGSRLWFGNGCRADRAQSLPSSGLDQVQGPPAPGQSCSGKIESGVPLWLSCHQEAPGTCSFVFSFFHILSNASTQSVAPGIPFDSGHLTQENSQKQNTKSSKLRKAAALFL